MQTNISLSMSLNPSDSSQMAALALFANTLAVGADGHLQERHAMGLSTPSQRSTDALGVHSVVPFAEFIDGLREAKAAGFRNRETGESAGDYAAALGTFHTAEVAADKADKTDEEKLDEMAGQLSGFLTLGRDRIREIIDTAMQDGAQGTPAEKTVKVLQSLIADVPGPGFGSENLTEATTKYFGDRRTVETAKANTRTRRTKAEVAADKAGKVGGFRNRETGESAEDYTEALHDHVKSYTNSEIKKAKAEAEALHDHVKSYTNSEIEKARAEAEALHDRKADEAMPDEGNDGNEITQETLTESVLAAVEPKGTPEGDDRRKKIRAFIAGRDHNTKNGAKASRIGELKTEDYRAVYDFAANLAK